MLRPLLRLKGLIVIGMLAGHAIYSSLYQSLGRDHLIVGQVTKQAHSNPTA